ncbi:MAG: hypothetical protein AVDCRST_MAG09-1001, partial [uncultured Sphingomonas sp.]
ERARGPNPFPHPALPGAAARGLADPAARGRYRSPAAAGTKVGRDAGRRHPARGRRGRADGRHPAQCGPPSLHGCGRSNDLGGRAVRAAAGNVAAPHRLCDRRLAARPCDHRRHRRLARGRRTAALEPDLGCDRPAAWAAAAARPVDRDAGRDAVRPDPRHYRQLRLVPRREPADHRLLPAGGRQLRARGYQPAARAL